MKTLLLLLAVNAFADKTHQGHYGIPAALAFGKFASFPTTYTVGTNEQGKKVLTYNLPEDIVGPTPVTIQLTESQRHPNGTFDFVGFGSDRGTCRAGALDVTCLVEYPSLELDPVAISKFIDSKYPGSPDNEARKGVMKIFIDDPKGIVNYARE